jgi:hypothetical protein
MECCVCGSDNTVVFSREDFLCKHCGEATDIIYGACNDCGAVWKSIDGGVVECMSYDMSTENLDKMMEKAPTVQVIDLNPRESTMSSMINKCLRCEAIAYEIGKGYYKCPDCDFEWEVI